MTVVVISPRINSVKHFGIQTAAKNRIRFVAAASPPDQAAPRERKPSPLEAGGTLSDDKAFGKDAGSSVKRKLKGEAVGNVLQIVEGEFSDFRWVDGRWNYNEFKNGDGNVDWDAVIDAEIARRQMLEESPIASINDAVKFDTSEIPWWAWVKRFHLPVAEKLNGRAAMIGYALAIVGEQLSGAGLLEQQNSFLGKLLLHIAVFGVLLIQEFKDIDKYRNLIDEAFFYDRQWAASWIGKQRPSENNGE